MFVLTVEGMSCANCVKHVTRAVHAQDPKARVEVKLLDRLVHIETTASLEKIKRAIENEGYRVTEGQERP